MKNEQIENAKLFTDEELVWATQLAYCDFVQSEIYDYNNIAEIVSQKGPNIYYSYDPTDIPEGDKLVMRNSMLEFLDDICSDDEEKQKCKGWKIVDVKDMENENGLYAITIETGENEAIIAFRGSESFTHNGSSTHEDISLDLEQIARDWVIADGGIAHGDFTDQELAAGQYLDYIAERFDYENLALTGHSLGGNLALVATVYSATEMSHTDASTRIRQSVSMDGPGHPAEFYEKYFYEIEQMQGVMTHYQWSWVGAILTSLCRGENYRHVKTSDKFQSLVLKHSTASLYFDLIYGSLDTTDDFYDDFAQSIHEITDWIDQNNLEQEVIEKVVDSLGKSLLDYIEWDESRVTKIINDKKKDVALEKVLLAETFFGT